MDSFAAFAMGQASRGKPLMVFDWVRAAQLIREAGATTAAAGLRSDWEWTGGAILADGKPVPADETYTYLASTWARPELAIDDGDPVECWCYQSETPGWDSGTYWPDEARALLGCEESSP